MTLAAPSRRPTLRAYQERDIERIRELIRGKRRRIVRQLGTGGGKTVEASYIIEGAVQKGKRIVFTGNRREHVSQCSHKLQNLDVEHGIIMADWPTHPRRLVQVASIQTLRNREVAPPDLLIIDECHHAKARTWLEIIERWPEAVVLGLTATPVRSDGKGLGGELFQDMVCGPSTPELIDGGYLVATKVYAPNCPDMAGVHTVAGEYNMREAAERMKSIVIGDVVEHWMKYGENSQTVLFACDIAGSIEHRDAFRRMGISAQHIDGTMAPQDRSALLREFDYCGFQVLCSVGVLTEGWDPGGWIPEEERYKYSNARCVIDVAPTKSLGRAIQKVGRVKRPWWDKRYSILLDHSGSVAMRGEHGWVRNHGHPDEAREWILTPDKEVCKPHMVADPMKLLTVCPKCGAVYRGQGIERCTCGYVFSKPKRSGPAVREGQLEEVLAASLQRLPEKERKRQWWRLRQTARKQGLKPGWVYYRYLAVFGEKPPDEWEYEYRDAMERLGQGKAPLFGEEYDEAQTTNT